MKRQSSRLANPTDKGIIMLEDALVNSHNHNLEMYESFRRKLLLARSEKARNNLWSPFNWKKIRKINREISYCIYQMNNSSRNADTILLALLGSQWDDGMDNIKEYPPLPLLDSIEIVDETKTTWPPKCNLN